MPILSLGHFPQVLYIDGFAGPGKYSGGEEGSPVIALRAAIEQRFETRTKFLFFFVEKDAERAAVLKETIDALPRPADRVIRVKIVPDKTFEEAFEELLAL